MTKYILIAVFDGLSAVNILMAYKQKPSQKRSVSLWFNGISLTLIAIATIISLLTNES